MIYRFLQRFIGDFSEEWFGGESTNSWNVSGISYILHEFFADWSDVFAQGGTVHHNLLLMRCGTENLLNISSHV